MPALALLGLRPINRRAAFRRQSCGEPSGFLGLYFSPSKVQTIGLPQYLQVTVASLIAITAKEVICRLMVTRAGRIPGVTRSGGTRR